MRIIDTRPPKICHARAGQIIRLPGEDGEPAGPFYLLAKIGSINPKVVESELRGCGLYGDPHKHLLVNLETGELRSLPHLSSRAEIIDHAELLVKEEECLYHTINRPRFPLPVGVPPKL